MNTLQRYIITGCLTAVALFLVWRFGVVVKYVLISAVLSLIGKPLVDILSKVKIGDKVFPKWLSATISLIVMWCIAIIAISLFVPIIVEKLNSISNFNFTDLTSSLKDELSHVENLIKSRFSIKLEMASSITNALEYRFKEYISPTLNSISTLFDTMISFIIGAFSVSFITFFFLRESALFNNGITMFFPSKYESNIRRALESSTGLISRYFIGLIIESTIKLIVIAAALYVLLPLSMSDSIIIALISAILNVIPYIGPIIGAAIGLLIAYASPEMIDLPNINLAMVTIIIIFALFQLIDNIIIQPYIYSSSVKAHPLEIFIVILLAGSLAGVVGMLLAIPAYTVIRVFAKEFFNKMRLVQKLTENI